MSDYIQAVTREDNNGALVWDSDGYYVIGDREWQSVVFTTTIKYSGGAIGVSPRVYENNMYMTFSIENKNVEGTEDGANLITQAYARLYSQVTYEEVHLGDKYLTPLVVGQKYVIKVEVVGTNYKIYLDGVLVFNIEYATMPRGRVGVYSTTGNKCYDMEVKSVFADGWASNASKVIGGIVSIRELSNEDKYLYLHKSSGTSSLYAEQEMSVVGGKDHTLSFDVQGSGLVQIMELNGASPSTYQMTITDVFSWTRYNMVRLINADCTRVRVRFSVTTTELMVNNVQLEDKKFPTTYIHNESTLDAAVREDSLITFPSKNNINQARGSVSMWVRPSITHDATLLRPVLFEYGDINGVIKLSYTGTGIALKYGTDDANSVSYATSFTADIWYHIVGIWSEAKLELYVDGVHSFKDTNYTLNNDVALIRIGHGYSGSDTVFNGAIDEVIVYSNAIGKEVVDEILTTTEPIQDNTAMIMRATFNHAVGNFNKSIIEATPSPQYGSPIVVEKKDGTVLNKVSFFDPHTGEYRTWNDEEVLYDGESNYLVISYDDVDVQNFAIKVRDLSGVEYGAPYWVDGQRVYVSLSAEEKAKLAGQKLLVSYQLENSYTVDYNIDVPDAFRINIGKYDGQPVKIHYEGNDFHDEKLATMVELNPLLNPNHEGFLYVTNNIEKVTSFRARVTPDDLPANGVSEGIVVVEPLDANGNFISHLQLEVKADKGRVIAAYDKQSVLLRERAGRYVYRYVAPLIHFSNSGKLQEEDRINIIDKETGIGVQIPISLTTLTVITHKIVSEDTLESISDEYGVSEEDIANYYEMSIVEMQQYVLNNVGTNLNIPISYSANLITKTKEEIAEEPMIVTLLAKVFQYLDQKASNLPTGLGDILDFNQDGLINIDEVVWLNENKGLGTISDKYNKLGDWEKNNAG